MARLVSSTWIGIVPLENGYGEIVICINCWLEVEEFLKEVNISFRDDGVGRHLSGTISR